MANALTNGIIAIRYVSLKGLVSGKVRVLPAPAREVVFNRDIQSQIQNQTGDAGQTVVQGQLITGEQPVLTLPYAFRTREILALAFGKTLASETYTGVVSRTFQPTKTSYAAAAAGKEGYGMTADQSASVMSALVGGVSVNLTRQTHGTFNAATPLSFSQGADGAFNVSTDIVTNKYFVTNYFPYAVSGSLVLQEDNEEDFEVTLVGILEDLSIFNLQFPSCFLDVPGMGSFNFGEATQNILIRPNVGGDACTYFKLAFLDRKFACAA